MKLKILIAIYLFILAFAEDDETRLETSDTLSGESNLANLTTRVLSAQDFSGVELAVKNLILYNHELKKS